MATSSITSDLKTTAAVIAVGRSRVNAVTVLTDGTNAATVILYDNASAASGKVLAKVIVPGANRTEHVVFFNPIVAENGVFASVSGTGAEYIVYIGG